MCSLSDSSACLQETELSIDDPSLPMMYRCSRTWRYGYACGIAVMSGGLLFACSHGDREGKAVPPDAVGADGRGSSASESGKGSDTLRASAGAEHVGVAADAVTWDAETVAGHLTGIGLTANAVGVVARPMFRARGQRFRVNGGRAWVEAYFYGDANAVALDNDQLDTAQVMPKGGTMRWAMPARLIVDNNMAAVVLTEDAALRTKINSALRSALYGSTDAR